MTERTTVAALIAIVLVILMATSLVSTIGVGDSTALAIIAGMYGSAVSAIAGFIVGSGKK